MNRLALSVLMVLLLAYSSAGDAKDRVLGIGEYVFKAIDQAQVMMDQEDFAGAIEHLERLAERRMTDYERAQVKRLTGNAYFQMDDIAGARRSFEAAVALPQMPDALVANLLENLGRIGLIMEDYDYAIARLNELTEFEDYDIPDIWILRAGAHFQKEEYAAAEVDLVRAIDAEWEAGEVPNQNWLMMLSSAFYMQDKFVETKDVLIQLVEHYPAERHVLNLAGLYGQLDDRQRQLSLIDALRDDERLSRETQYKMLASLLLAEEVPYKAALILEEGIDSGLVEETQTLLEQLSQAWYLAGDFERAIPPLERAAEMSEDGEIYMRLAGLLMDNYRWADADAAAGKALDMGGLDEAGRAWLLRGMALANLDRLSEAKAFFARAVEFEESARYAKQWLAYVENEEQIASARGGD